MLTNLFITLGWSRDDLKWLILQIVAVAGLITSNAFDVPYWCAYLGIPLSPTALHWVFGIAAVVLWLAGKYDSSSLPSGPAMKSGTVPTSPASMAKTGASVLLACMLAGGSMMGCASTQPPPGTYTPPVTKMFQADELIKALDAVVVTAKNFNATTGRLHLSDANTKLVIDTSEVVGAGLYSWGQGATTLGALKIAIDSAQLTPGRLAIARVAIDQAITDHGAGASALYIVKDVYATLRANIAVDASTNTTLALALDGVDALIALIPLQ